MPVGPEPARILGLRVLARGIWSRSGGSVCGTLIGALAGWYGALAGFALGAMLDAARQRYRLSGAREAEREGADDGRDAAEPDSGAPDPSEAARLLGLAPEADRTAIKRAFWRISRASHPDGPDPDPERFMAAKRAAEALLRRLD